VGQTVAELWTAADIMLERNLERCALVFLSACESGAGELILNSMESAGLPAAFQSLGVPTVVSSFWPVREDLAALYARLFYRRLGRASRRADLLGDRQAGRR
jgi:CHAT domain-containing protein